MYSTYLANETSFALALPGSATIHQHAYNNLASEKTTTSRKRRADEELEGTQCKRVRVEARIHDLPMKRVAAPQTKRAQIQSWLQDVPTMHQSASSSVETSPLTTPTKEVIGLGLYLTPCAQSRKPAPDFTSDLNKDNCRIPGRVSEVVDVEPVGHAQNYDNANLVVEVKPQVRSKLFADLEKIFGVDYHVPENHKITLPTIVELDETEEDNDGMGVGDEEADHMEEESEEDMVVAED